MKRNCYCLIFTLTLCVAGVSPALADISGAAQAKTIEAPKDNTADVAANWTIDTDRSSITFGGSESGNKFQGKIEKVEASIIFDPENLDKTAAVLTFDMATAKTGNASYDGALKGAEWLNIDRFPTAQFKLGSIVRQSGGGQAGDVQSADYTVTGDFTLAGVTKQISFPAHISITDTHQAEARADFTIPRLDYNIGRQADGDGTIVSQDITVNVLIIADYHDSN